MLLLKLTLHPDLSEGTKKNKRLKYVFETELKAGQQQFLQVNYNICSLRTFALCTFFNYGI